VRHGYMGCRCFLWDVSPRISLGAGVLT
jgi:hypothetical protein